MAVRHASRLRHADAGILYMSSRRSAAAESGSKSRVHPASGRGIAGAPWFLPAVIFVVALVLRLIYVLQIRHTPFFQTLGLDARFYDQWARSLAAGEGHGGPFFMSPLYPYFLAGLYRLFGRDLLIVRVVQSILGAGTAALVYLLALDLFDRGVATIAGFVAACYGALIFYDGSIVMTPLLVFLNVAALTVLVKADHGGRAILFAASGALLGLAGVGRAAALLFAPIAFWWVLFGTREMSAKNGSGVRKASRGAGGGRGAGQRVRGELRLREAGLFAVGVLLVLAPVTIRNLAVSGQFIPVTSNGGLNFYIGNSAIATGGYAMPEGLDIERDPSGSSIAEADVGRTLSASEVSDYWYSRSWNDIGADPGHWVALLLRKLSFVMSSYELPQLENFEFQRHYSRLLSVPLPGFGLVAPLGVLGLILALRDRRRRLLGLFFGAYVISIVLFFVLARYRLPVTPVLAIGASYVVVEGFDRVRTGAVRRAVWLVPAALALAFVVNANLYAVDREKPFAQIHYRLGIIYGDRGDVGRAVAEYGRAIEIDPTYPKSYLNLGALLAKEGEYDEAVAAFKKALAMDPAYTEARVNLATVHIGEGRYDDAVGELQAALEHDPASALARAQLGVALYKSGRVDEALAELKRAEDADGEGTERAEIEFYRALIERPEKGTLPAATTRVIARADSLTQNGRPAEAAGLLREAVELAPDSGAPLQKLALLERNMGLLNEAIGHLREALRIDPGIPHGHFMLGVFLNESEQHDAAIQEYEAELRLDPTYAPAHRNLATSCLYFLADRNRAQKHYREYLRLGGEPVPPLDEALLDTE